MNSYYENDEKLTFDEAEQYVRRYIAECQRSYITAKDIAIYYDLVCNQHNLVRINNALNDTLNRAPGTKVAYRI